MDICWRRRRRRRQIHNQQGFPITLGQQFSFLSLRESNVVIY